MKNRAQKKATRRAALSRRPRFAPLLTPQERKAILLVFGLFLLGVVVRWVRLH